MQGEKKASKSRGSLHYGQPKVLQVWDSRIEVSWVSSALFLNFKLSTTVERIFTWFSSHRLRYHGSYLSPIPTKCNGGLAKNEPKVERAEEKKDEEANKSKFKLSELTFSFETVPENEKWYQTFRRQDRVEQRYCFSNNCKWIINLK